MIAHIAGMPVEELLLPVMSMSGVLALALRRLFTRGQPMRTTSAVSAGLSAGDPATRPAGSDDVPRKPSD